MPGHHAKKAPSAAHRWMNCAGSLRMSEGIADTTSEFAAEGTAAHHLAEHCGENGWRADRFLGQFIGLDADDNAVGFYPSAEHAEAAKCPRSFEVTEEMAEGVQLYLDTVRKDIKPGDEFGWEDRVYLNDEIYGTTDAWRYRPSEGLLTVYDLKFGRGVVVEVHENEQEIICGVGTARKLSNRGSNASSW